LENKVSVMSLVQLDEPRMEVFSQNVYIYILTYGLLNDDQRAEFLQINTLPYPNLYVVTQFLATYLSPSCLITQTPPSFPLTVYRDSSDQITLLC
jgi:hypothetical protein